ncbi:lipoate--protein ligase family protein [Halorarius litoreus]|uniref:lipoate--protein ligase family protein n=1 Tax=Halorarius litoreus TaxID=2962676 RepID=UPI0020CE2D02|nr:lipoate--protein ligase family protein [Halorarius litoreus]
MRVVRGRGESIAADRAVTERLREDVRETGESVVRVWTPHRQLAFGRRDTHAAGYSEARAAAEEHGFPPYERSVGGRAVAHTGSTLAFARIEPVDDIRRGLDARYDAAVRDLRVALETLGVTAERGEPPESFCPGDHSLSSSGKLVGIAQRVSTGAAATAGILVVRDHAEIAAVLDPVYHALGVPFAPDSVGSVERAGGDGDPERVASAVENALVGEREATVERLG